ncbi:MAG: CBS domain-containing protein [Thermodesulfovibrionales bacterium]|jgi:CBS domain-containing protein
MTAQERLKEIADQLSEGRTISETVREILSWFNASRRGYWIVQQIRDALKQESLRTEPDFESAYIDSSVDFILTPEAQSEQPSVAQQESITTFSEPTAVSPAAPPLSYADPTHRISKLAASNRKPIFVAPDARLDEAITLMLANDFSQLPVMTSEREVKGIINWGSIGSRLALGKGGIAVNDFIDQHQEIHSDASLFSAIRQIAEHNYVLVRGHDQRITGIITASDLNLQFLQLAEPFLLLGEIENHIRRIISKNFNEAELQAAKDPSDSERIISSVADLSFGEYIRLLENHDRWSQLSLSIDRKTGSSVEFVGMKRS